MVPQAEMTSKYSGLSSFISELNPRTRQILLTFMLCSCLLRCFTLWTFQSPEKLSLHWRPYQKGQRDLHLPICECTRVSRSVSCWLIHGDNWFWNCSKNWWKIAAKPTVKSRLWFCCVWEEGEKDQPVTFWSALLTVHLNRWWAQWPFIYKIYNLLRYNNTYATI